MSNKYFNGCSTLINVILFSTKWNTGYIIEKNLRNIEKFWCQQFFVSKNVAKSNTEVLKCISFNEHVYVYLDDTQNS